MDISKDENKENLDISPSIIANRDKLKSTYEEGCLSVQPIC